MAEPADMIVPLLHEMRAENQALHGATAGRLDLIERRLKKLEETQVSYRQALSPDSLLSKLVTGEFEERIEALERKVRELEAHP
jgi:polyhydroxyalkanoate synthesis regulator phasin